MDSESHPLDGPSSSTAAKRLITALPKGKACLECRKRKVKCDALSPCNGCIRMRKECIYEEEWERIQRLQGTVAKLEKKLKRLQEATDVGEDGSMTTAKTTPQSGRKVKETSAEPQSVDSVPTFPAAEFTFTSEDEPDLSGDWWQAEEPPRHIRAHLIQIFFDTSRTGYTIHKPRFWKSLHLPTKYQPHPALLNVMYLIACHHSGNSLLIQHQDVYLARARHHLEHSLKHRDRLLHFLSASTLLAYYFLKTGRFLEASYQISSTARFAIFCGLHQITSPVWKPPPRTKDDVSETKLLSLSAVAAILSPPIDAIDLGERINLFWMIVLVDHSASLITGLPTSINYEQIETVWPRAIEDYESGAADNDRESVRSLFETGNQTAEMAANFTMSEMTRLKQTQTKAIVLLERVVKFANWAKGLPIDQVHSPAFTANFTKHYDAVRRHLANTPPLNILSSSLSPSDSSSTLLSPTSPSTAMGLGFARGASTPRSNSNSLSVPPPPPVPKFLLVHSYGLVSYIHLYNSMCRSTGDDGPTGETIPGCYQKRLDVAKSILADIRALAASGTDFRKHLMMQGFAWGVAARVFAHHISKLKAENVPEDDLMLAEARQDLADVVTPIRILCGVFPILEFQLDRLRVEENG